MSYKGIVLVPVLMLSSAGPLLAGKPSFDCEKAQGEVEQAICADSTLAALDVQMSEVWGQVMALVKDSDKRTMIEGEQQSWTRDRDACLKESEMRPCIALKYRTRIAELQARWQLLPAKGPLVFACDGNPANQVVAEFFETDPPAARLERAGQIVVVFRAPAASGAKYEGRHVTFWTKGSEALVTWGYGAEEMKCELRE